ncbi:muconolactone Delta-isomerase family protein [Ectobacillus panaciterrae]|uniref:muconolactone Delta-isomerase family protein n=1 Tax=Ectobacillus panaciterrae TaxID=363872 RepID=UPI000420F14F|nr:muconolactone Delta-isomerase family protein [Ectobacillus panaciterrae]
MRFLVHVKIDPSASEEEIAELLPAEQTRFAELVEQGLINTFYLSHKRDEHWSLCIADSDDELRKALESLPLYKFMKIEYTQLIDGTNQA